MAFLIFSYTTPGLRSNRTIEDLLPDVPSLAQCSHTVPSRRRESVKVRQRSDKDVKTFLSCGRCRCGIMLYEVPSVRASSDVEGCRAAGRQWSFGCDVCFETASVRAPSATSRFERRSGRRHGTSPDSSLSRLAVDVTTFRQRLLAACRYDSHL